MLAYAAATNPKGFLLQAAKPSLYLVMDEIRLDFSL